MADHFVAVLGTTPSWPRGGDDYLQMASATVQLDLESQAKAELRAQLLSRGLGLAPANRLGWLRLTELRLATHQRTPDRQQTAMRVAQALSLGLGRDAVPESRTLLLVAGAGMASWDHLDAIAQRSVATVVRRSWQAQPLQTASAAKRYGRSDLLATLAGL